MRPPSHPRLLLCALAGALIAACDNGDSHLGPGGPGSGGSRAGAGGSPTWPTGGSGGSSSGGGGNTLTGAGGTTSTGAGGTTSTGAGGTTSTGAGGTTSTGAGGNLSTGTGGNLPTGTGGGLAGTAGGRAGAGGGLAGAGGSLAGAGGSLAGAGGRGGTAGSGSGGAAGRGGSTGARCGNGVRDPELFERCDGEDLGGETCQSLRGFASGTIRCSSSCLFDTSACSPCSKDPVVINCGVTPPDLSPFAVAMGSNGTEVAFAWATGADAYAGRLRLTRLSAALDTISSVRVNEPGLQAAGYGGSDSFWVAPLPSGWVVAGIGLNNNVFVHTFDAAGANVGRFTVKMPTGDVYQVAVVPRPDGGPLLFCATNEADYAVTHLYAAVISADGASTTAPVEVPVDDGYVTQIGRGTYANGQFYVPFTMEMLTDTVTYREGHLEIARVAAAGTLSGVADPLPGVDVHTPALAVAGGQLALSYQGIVDGASTADPRAPTALLSLRLELSGAAASATPLVLADRAAQGALLSVGDAVVQVLDEAKLTLGTYYPGESLELVRVPATGPLGAKHQLMAAGDLPYWTWLDAVSVGSDVVIAWASGGETPLQLIRARP